VCDYTVIAHFPDNEYLKQLTPFLCVNMVNSRCDKLDLLIPQQVQIKPLKWQNTESYTVTLGYDIMEGNEYFLSLQISVVLTDEYSGTSVHEFNSFLEAVHNPKCS
jgi:hypothetical protein